MLAECALDGRMRELVEPLRDGARLRHARRTQPVRRVVGCVHEREVHADLRREGARGRDGEREEQRD